MNCVCVKQPEVIELTAAELKELHLELAVDENELGMIHCNVLMIWTHYRIFLQKYSLMYL